MTKQLSVTHVNLVNGLTKFNQRIVKVCHIYPGINNPVCLPTSDTNYQLIFNLVILSPLTTNV